MAPAMAARKEAAARWPRRARGRRVEFSMQLDRLFGQRADLGGVKLGRNLRAVNADPPVYLVDDFLKEGELRYFERLHEEYRATFDASRSFTEAPDGRRVVSKDRTSSTAHLRKFGNSKVRTIEQRAADLVGMPVENVEPLQVVRYERGQHYGLHHDCGELMPDGTVDGGAGVACTRIVTIFVYVNTLPREGGGCTFFPQLGGKQGLAVRPKRGRAVLWCNLTRDGALDTRMVHEAKPTAKGFRKLGLNIWISTSSMLDLTFDGTGLVLDEPTWARAKKKKQAEMLKRAREKVKRLASENSRPADNAGMARWLSNTGRLSCLPRLACKHQHLYRCRCRRSGG